MTTPSAPLDSNSLLLVTGGTGLVGSHVVERAIAQGWKVRALVQPSSNQSFLRSFPLELVQGSLADPPSLVAATRDVTHCVHCAAKVGDWGPVRKYRQTNVEGLRSLVAAFQQSGSLRQFIQISSLGVYPAVDHHGTDETSPVSTNGIDGYTISKVESENLILNAAQQSGFPAIVLRPGWVYGPRDRTVMPQLLKSLQQGKVVYLGSGQQLLNQIYVENLVDAIFLALPRTDLAGRVYNLTDGLLVSRIEFMETICRLAKIAPPRKHIPLGVARSLASVLEGTYRLFGSRSGPILSQARIKFLGLNLDYSIDRAIHELNYTHRFRFQEGMQATMDWVQGRGFQHSE